MTIAYARELAKSETPDQELLEAACLSALILESTLTDAERAEMLLLYAETVGHDQNRRPGTAPYADKAAELAVKIGDFVLATKAACHAIYAQARVSALWRTFYGMIALRTKFQCRVGAADDRRAGRGSSRAHSCAR